jgi:hypothetical protein
MKETDQSLSIPIKLGIIIGLVYSALIFIQNQFLYKNPLQFSIIKLAFYFVILAGIFYTGFLSKKDFGGYITFQEVLKAMLLAIAIAELFYLIFSTLYIKFIEPDFFIKLKTSWQQFFAKNNLPQDQIDSSLERFNEAGKITAWGLIQSYGFSIIIDAVFAVIFAIILKKEKTVYEN